MKLKEKGEKRQILLSAIRNFYNAVCDARTATSHNRAWTNLWKVIDSLKLF